jgi:hypothetical protein
MGSYALRASVFEVPRSEITGDKTTAGGAPSATCAGSATIAEQRYASAQVFETVFDEQSCTVGPSNGPVLL